MNSRSPTLRLHTLLSALEDDVTSTSDSEILAEPFSSIRAESVRRMIFSSLSASGIQVQNSLSSRLPAGIGAKRELLRRALTLPPAQTTASMSFSSPDDLSDSEVESALQTMLQAGLLPKDPDKK